MMVGRLGASCNYDVRLSLLPQKPENALPFDSCDQFVGFLVNLASKAAKHTFGHSTVRNHHQVARTLRTVMMSLAFSGYDRHYHNGFLDFKPEHALAREPHRLTPWMT